MYGQAHVKPFGHSVHDESRVTNYSTHDIAEITGHRSGQQSDSLNFLSAVQLPVEFLPLLLDLLALRDVSADRLHLGDVSGVVKDCVVQPLLPGRRPVRFDCSMLPA